MDTEAKVPVDIVLIGGLVVLSVILGLSGFILTEGSGNANMSGNIERFSSAEEFEMYMQRTSGRVYYPFGFGGQDIRLDQVVRPALNAMKGEVYSAIERSRFSKTNVQERGIDEPDIVKTDGRNIFFSGSQWSDEMRILDALPAENLSKLAGIEKGGKLLRKDDFLVIFSQEKIYGYDVSNPAKPEEKWTMELNGSVVSARLKDSKIYMAIKNDVDNPRPCPIKPVITESGPVSIDYTDIYHPVKPVPVDVTYTSMVFNVGTGEVKDTVSFVGSESNSVVYQSKNAIYVTYTSRKDRAKLMIDFLTDEGSDLLPENIVNRIEKLKGYNISRRAKRVEIRTILKKYESSLNKNEAMEFRNELSNRMREYFEAHKRELIKTGIVKISTENGLNISNTGEVPGYLLNQFSMDEYKGNLRIATTVGEWSESGNDVYILDEKLEILGSVKGLGKQQRIYSVRFIRDKGYVVTFRRKDPFYVLDLSSPSNPKMKGELKIKGYSSYLHPIKKNMILGIGKEDGKVKISLFDVSKPANPEEIDKYNLDEHWSEVNQTHHAFLQDEKHNVFFLPGSRGGYIFSYEGNELKLVRAISAEGVKRAIYINDYMYILSREKVTVVNENNWRTVENLELELNEVPKRYETIK